MIALLFGVALLAANAVFVAAEFASIAARQTTLEAKVAGGSRLASLALQSTRNIQLQLAGAQLGITMASLGLGSVLEPFVDHELGAFFEWLGFIPEGLTHPIIEPPRYLVRRLAPVESDAGRRNPRLCPALEHGGWASGSAPFWSAGVAEDAGTASAQPKCAATGAGTACLAYL